jgi:hypothetical protein
LGQIRLFYTIEISGRFYNCLILNLMLIVFMQGRVRRWVQFKFLIKFEKIKDHLLNDPFFIFIFEAMATLKDFRWRTIR